MAYGRSEWDSALQFGRQLQNTYFLRRSSSLPLNGTIAILDPNITSADGQPFQTTISGIFHSMLENGSFNMPSGLYISTAQVKTVSGYQPSGSAYVSQRNGFPAVVKRFSQEQYEGIQNQLEANWYLQGEIEALASGQPVVVPESDTPPPLPNAGSLWYNTSTLELKIWYVDPSGDAQWVPTAIPLSSQEDFTTLQAEVQTISGEVVRDRQNLFTVSGILASGIKTRFSAYGGNISDNPDKWAGANYTTGNLTMYQGYEDSVGGKIYGRRSDGSYAYTIFADGTFSSTARSPLKVGGSGFDFGSIDVFGADGSFKPFLIRSSDAGTGSTGMRNMMTMTPGRIVANDGAFIASGTSSYMGFELIKSGQTLYQVDGQGRVLQGGDEYSFESSSNNVDIKRWGKKGGGLHFYAGGETYTDTSASGFKLGIDARGVNIGDVVKNSSGFPVSRLIFGNLDGTTGSGPAEAYLAVKSSTQTYEDYIRFNQNNIYILKQFQLNDKLTLDGQIKNQAGYGSSSTSTWPSMVSSSYNASGFYFGVYKDEYVFSFQGSNSLDRSVPGQKGPFREIFSASQKHGVKINGSFTTRRESIFYLSGDQSNMSESNAKIGFCISGVSPDTYDYKQYTNKILAAEKLSNGHRMIYTGVVQGELSLVNKYYVDTAISQGFAGGSTLTNPSILGTTQYGTSGEGQILNCLHKPPGSGLEIWVGPGSVGTSEKVVDFTKEGVTYIKPTSFQKDTEFAKDVIVQETLASNGPVSYIQRNIANSIMHKMDGFGNTIHAGSGTFLKNMYIKGDTLLMGNTTAKQLVVNNNTTIKGATNLNGATTNVAGQLGVTGNANLSNALSVNGKATFYSNFQIVGQKANISSGMQVYTGLDLPTGDLTVSNGKIYIDDQAATQDNRGIEFRSTQTVQAIRAYGNASKSLKFFIGPTSTTTTQAISIAQSALTLGNNSVDTKVVWNGNNTKHNLEFPANHVLQTVYGNTQAAALGANQWTDVPPIAMAQDASISGVANVYGASNLQGNQSLNLVAVGSSDNRVNFFVGDTNVAYASTYGLVAPSRSIQAQQFAIVDYNGGYGYLYSYGNTNGLSVAVAPQGGQKADVVNTCVFQSNAIRPQVSMIFANNKTIKSLPTPTDSGDAAPKSYVDGKLTSLYGAVNTSTDFETLKANLLATLSGAFN